MHASSDQDEDGLATWLVDFAAIVAYATASTVSVVKVVTVVSSVVVELS